MKMWCLFITVISLLYINDSNATDVTADFRVSVDVVNSCTVSVENMGFPDYNSINNSSATARITALCTAGTAYQIKLNAGQGAGASTTTRKLTKGGQTIDYGIYKDAGHANIWGDNGGDVVAATGTAGNQTHTMYGKIDLGQNPTADTDFADTVTVTLTY